MPTLNLHNHGGLTGNRLIRVPHAGGYGLTVGGSQIPVDDLGGQLYIKRSISGTYSAAYAATSETQTLDPASVWATYDPLTTLPAWLTSTGTATAQGIALNNQLIRRTAQTVNNLVWGFEFDLPLFASITVSIGTWSMTVQAGNPVVTFADGLTATLHKTPLAGTHTLVIEQKAATGVSQTTTLLIRLDDVTLTDCVPSLFGATADLTISGRATVRGWRQDVTALRAPTLSLVRMRGSTAAVMDVDPSGTVHTEYPFRAEYWGVGLWSYTYQGQNYQLASWVGESMLYQGIIARRQLPNHAWQDVFEFPASTYNETEYGAWFAMNQWNFAQDSRGWLYLQSYGLGTWNTNADPLPQVWRSRDNAATWEMLPLTRASGFGLEQMRHGHSLYYHPDADVLYATYGEYGTYNVYKFANLSATNVAQVTVEPLPWASRKGPLSARHNGTSVIFCPPDEWPVAFMRLDTETDTWRIGPLHHGLLGNLKFGLTPVPTDFGTLLLSDGTNVPELPPQMLVSSQSGTHVRYAGDYVCFGWTSPPTGHCHGMASALKSGGTAVHEYWNGTAWVALTATSITDGYSLSGAATGWARRRASAFGLGEGLSGTYSPEPVNDPMFWTRIRVTANYPSDITPIVADNFATHPVIIGLLSAHGDSCDTEVEYAVKTTAAIDGRDICFYEPGKTGAAWTQMPFAIDAVGEFATQDLDPYVEAPPAPLLYDLLVSGAPANPLPDITDDGTGSDTATLDTVRPLPDATDAGYGSDEAELAAAVDALFFDLLVSGMPSGELGALTDAGEGGDVATLGAIRPLPDVADAGEGGDMVRDGAALSLPLSATAIRRGFTATVTRKQHTAELTNRRGQQ